MNFETYKKQLNGLQNQLKTTEEQLYALKNSPDNPQLYASLTEKMNSLHTQLRALDEKYNQERKA